MHGTERFGTPASCPHRSSCSSPTPRTTGSNGCCRCASICCGSQRVGLIEIWEDSRIDPGEGWDETIAAALETADIVLLLVSSAFTASEYCHRELTRALERRRKGSAEVIWIYVDHCDYGAMPFAGLEGMPKGKDGRLQPLVECNRKEQARHLADASKKIRELAVGIAEAKHRTVAPEVLAEPEVVDPGDARVLESLVARAEVVGKELGVPVEVLRSILANLVGAAGVIDPEVIEAQLRAKAREFLDLSAHLAELVSEDPRVAELRRTASDALAKGDFDAADEALADAERYDRKRAEEAAGSARDAPDQRGREPRGARRRGAACGSTISLPPSISARPHASWRRSAITRPGDTCSTRRQIWGITAGSVATTKRCAWPSHAIGLLWIRPPGQTIRTTGPRPRASSAPRLRPPTAPRWRNGPASACRSTGR